MQSKVYLVLFATIFLGLSASYFILNSSYKDSIQARVYYVLGNYESAYDLASTAYESDNYNKMAFTVMVQSKIAKNYTNYIDQGNIYLAKIDAISSKEVYSTQDKLRVKMMCEIMIESFESLSPTKLTDKDLQEKSALMQAKFKQLYEELF